MLVRQPRGLHCARQPDAHVLFPRVTAELSAGTRPAGSEDALLLKLSLHLVGFSSAQDDVNSPDYQDIRFKIQQF